MAEECPAPLLALAGAQAAWTLRADMDRVISSENVLGVGGWILKACFPNLNMSTNPLGVLLKCSV